MSLAVGIWMLLWRIWMHESARLVEWNLYDTGDACSLLTCIIGHYEFDTGYFAR